MRMRLWINLIFVVLLSFGCATTAPSSSSVSPLPARAPAQAAISSKPPATPQAERAKVHTELGSLYLQEGRPAIALEEARIALDIDASYAPAYNLFGLTHMALGDDKYAAENFERALNLVPGDPEFSNNYGWFLCQTGQEKKSIEYFVRAARNPLYATPTFAYTNLGICHARLNDMTSAQSSLLQAYRLTPNNTLAIFWLSKLAFDQGHWVEAKHWMVELERQLELTSEALWLALKIERKSGNRENEARYAAQLRKRFPGSVEFQKLLRGEYE
jgi:type IV pilus assembly protein PilF